MRRARWILPMLIVARCTMASGQPGDEAAIRRQMAAYADARQRGDGSAQAAFYAPDADEWRSSTRKMVRGRAAIAADLGLNPSPSRRFRIDVESIAFLKPDVALLDTEFFGAAPIPNGRATYVMVKRDSVWLIRSARIDRYPEAPPSASAGASAVDDVRRTNEEMLAASRRGDRDAMARLVGDDLRWVAPDGRVMNKQQRLAQMEPGGRTFERVWRDVDIQVNGLTAVLIARSDFSPGGRLQSERVHRVFVNRGGRWQLTSHSSTPMPTDR